MLGYKVFNHRVAQGYTEFLVFASPPHRLDVCEGKKETKNSVTTLWLKLL